MPLSSVPRPCSRPPRRRARIGRRSPSPASLGAVHQPDGRAVPRAHAPTTTRSPTGSGRRTAITTASLTADEMQADAERFFASSTPTMTARSIRTSSPITNMRLRRTSRSCRAPSALREHRLRLRARAAIRTMDVARSECTARQDYRRQASAERCRAPPATACSTCPSRSPRRIPTSTAASRSTNSRQAAIARFQLLDTTRSGALTLAQLQAMRPAPTDKAQRRTRSGRCRRHQDRNPLPSGP